MAGENDASPARGVAALLGAQPRSHGSTASMAHHAEESKASPPRGVCSKEKRRWSDEPPTYKRSPFTKLEPNVSRDDLRTLQRSSATPGQRTRPRSPLRPPSPETDAGEIDWDANKENIGRPSRSASASVISKTLHGRILAPTLDQPRQHQHVEECEVEVPLDSETSMKAAVNPYEEVFDDFHIYRDETGKSHQTTTSVANLHF